MGIENILSKIINFVSQERGNKNNNIIFDYKKVSLLHKLEKKGMDFQEVWILTIICNWQLF